MTGFFAVGRLLQFSHAVIQPRFHGETEVLFLAKRVPVPFVPWRNRDLVARELVKVFLWWVVGRVRNAWRPPYEERLSSGHFVKEGTDFCAVVSGAEFEGEIPVRVADISNMGVRLNVRAKLAIGSKLELKFVAPEIELETRRNLSVRWVHASGGVL